MSNSKYHFGGWATKYNVKCSDQRTIMKNAFKHHDGEVIPLVWNHNYDRPEDVIGKATLQHRDGGVYAYCEFNESETSNAAKEAVKHGDITSLSIYANKLTEKGGHVFHGNIKEVSLVIAAANPGACIQEVMVHGDDESYAATIYNDEDEGLEIIHSDLKESDDSSDETEEVEPTGDITHSDDPTVAEVYQSMTEEQKKVVAYLVEEVANQNDDNEAAHSGINEEEDSMKENVFTNNDGKEVKVRTGGELSHSEVAELIKSTRDYSSFKEGILAHAATYGIQDVETLFPEAKLLNDEPFLIDIDQTWVGPFLNGLAKSPFTRIRNIGAIITAEEARARGYIKGNLKKEQVISLMKRSTDATTVYVKQKIDRDDVLDITDFNVIQFLQKVMRIKLNEELARAVLIGDGRLVSSDDKIDPTRIRPIATDEELYTIKYAMDDTAGLNRAKEFIKACVKSRVDYEGTGLPNCYLTAEMLVDLRLIEDENGRRIYQNLAALKDDMMVKEIIEVPHLKGFKIGADFVKAILVNPHDYTLGANAGGKISTFDAFDIDYNQHKYLMETRVSGSLMRPKTAIVIKSTKA